MRNGADAATSPSREIMNPRSGDGRTDETGYSSPGCACPRCNGPAIRVRRRLLDLLVSMFMTVNRYRCRSTACGWEGTLRIKRQPLLIQGPW